LKEKWQRTYFCIWFHTPLQEICKSLRYQLVTSIKFSQPPGLTQTTDAICQIIIALWQWQYNTWHMSTTYLIWTTELTVTVKDITKLWSSINQVSWRDMKNNDNTQAIIENTFFRIYLQSQQSKRTPFEKIVTYSKVRIDHIWKAFTYAAGWKMHTSQYGIHSTNCEEQRNHTISNNMYSPSLKLIPFLAAVSAKYQLQHYKKISYPSGKYVAWLNRSWK
jgi:hypothetical protein